MKPIFRLLTVISLFISCSSDNNYTKNPNLIDVSFNFNANMDFAEYNQLKFQGNSYTTYQEGVGILGIVIYNINNQQYIAFELADPNHLPSDCDPMRVEGLTAISSCGNEYSIITGELTKGEGNYSLKPYRVEKNGNILRIYN
ncbi:hypothetical protein [Zunongwangia sp.]|uniref:hypothetical protein n=1 Tax=Zunongwangia sp. TaxID=1965325 RepID=UPI003AA89FAD